MLNKITALIKLSRPGNVAITGLSVLVGTSGYGLETKLLQIMLAAASTMLIAAGGNSLNDYYDLEIDCVNRPQRTLPAGELKPRIAYLYGLVCMLAGVALSYFIGWPPLGMALTVSVLLWVYAARGKSMGLWGNGLVALVCGLAFVYGGLAAGNVGLSLFPAGFALLMHFSRELVKDVQDRAGDQAAGARTAPIVLGDRLALRISALSLLLLIMLTPLPYLMGIYNIRYLLMVLGGVDLLLLIMIFVLWANPDREIVAKISFFLKLEMLAGIMAICMGLS
jgi:geranylgeranylglycerol-phosphate geranylgeranyltransferase